MKVLLTGATGFLGSHLAEALINDNVELMVVKRKASSCENLSLIIDKIRSVDIEVDSWMFQICDFCPDIIIHSAWTGVSSEDRSNLNSQMANIDFINQLLFIADKCRISKFIALGSQAEYGKLSEKVSEDVSLNPQNNYGLLKVCAYHQIASFCELRGIEWYWLRIFSVYGERQSKAWLLPNVIINAGSKKEMDFTLGEQKYAYLYVKDFVTAVLKVCKKKKGASGTYNISSSHVIEIRELLKRILSKMNSSMKLNFGAKPYREEQSMYIGGDSSKFINEFGIFEQVTLNEGIEYLITYYKDKNEII